MNCIECGTPIERPTHFERELEVCINCVRKSIPQINPSIGIDRPLGKVRCVFCLGTIYTYKEDPRKIDTLTDGAITGIIGAHHPICKNRFLAELTKRGYTLITKSKTKGAKRKRYKRKKKAEETPDIKSLEDMKKWITKPS